MADQEVIKHTKKIYSIWNSKEHSLWQKVKEFILEILIIVFAVSLSIWLHDKSEHNNEQKIADEFMLGLREDLLSDINEMTDDRESYLNQERAFRYITSVKFKTLLNIDSLNKYQRWLITITRFQQNNGRFEGFKSSGKIGSIEDKILQNDIMDLYQENIPSLLSSTDAYIHTKNQFFDFVIKNRRRITDSTTNMSAILLTDEGQNLCSFMASPDEIINRYNVCINKMKLIVTEIENKYDIPKK